MGILEDALKQGIVPAIVVAIYLIITKIIDSRKENIQMKLSTDLTNSINTISSFIVSLTKNIIDKDKEKCKSAIEDAMYSAAMRLINFVSSTIINNHIDSNKEIIIANIHNIVNSEFYNISYTLSLYKIDGRQTSDYLKIQWIEEIEKDIINVIYEHPNLGKEDKILSFSNKIIIRFQSYITYITNNTVK